MTADHFAVFGLPRCFHVDTAVLDKCYFDAQREFHPDRLVGKSAGERQRAIGRSMLINEAYQLLKSPLERARHLLALEGIALDSVKPDKKLLVEIMELRESLADATGAEALEKLVAQNENAEEDTLVALARAFTGLALGDAAQLTMRLSYLVKLKEEIRIKKKAVSASST